MKASIFLSYPKPFYKVQQEFIDELCAFLKNGGFTPRTIGITDHDMDTLLKTTRRIMMECNGLITVAFRRTYIERGFEKKDADLKGQKETAIENKWITSPWTQIESAMAYQTGLPILILRESGVIEEGIFEKGILGLYMPAFDLAKGVGNYFDSVEWNESIKRWEEYVRSVIEKKSNSLHTIDLFHEYL